MKAAILALGTAPLLILAAPQAASAQARAEIRQVGRAAPSGLGNYGRVAGAPFSDPLQGRSGYRSGRHRGHEWGSQYGYDLVGGIYGGVYEDPETLRQAGFFAGPARSWKEGGQVRYEYDRGYPYDWYRPRDGASAPEERSAGTAGSRIRCEVEGAGIRVCRGRR